MSKMGPRGVTSGKDQTLKGSGSCGGKAGHSLSPAGSPVPPFRGGRLSTCQSSAVSWAPEPPCGPLWARAVCHCAQPSQARVVLGAWRAIKTPVCDGDPGWVRGGRGAGAATSSHGDVTQQRTPTGSPAVPGPVDLGSAACASSPRPVAGRVSGARPRVPRRDRRGCGNASGAAAAASNLPRSRWPKLAAGRRPGLGRGIVWSAQVWSAGSWAGGGGGPGGGPGPPRAGAAAGGCAERDSGVGEGCRAPRPGRPSAWCG